MASDTPAEEFQSVEQESRKQIFQSYAVADDKSNDDSNKSQSEDGEACDILGQRDKVQKNSQSGESEDRSAFSSIGQKINQQQKDDLLVLDYEQLSSMSEGHQEETKDEPRNVSQSKRKSELAKIITQENFPDSDKEEENEGSEGIDEGFLQVASAGSFNTGSLQDETKNTVGSSNQDEAAMFAINSDEAVGEDMSAGQAELIQRQSVTEDQQKLATLMRMRRQFDDRANKMRMDLLSMKKTAATNKPGGGNNSGADPAKSDEDF